MSLEKTSFTADQGRQQPSKVHKSIPIDPQRQTRLLDLLHGAVSDPIVCRLVRHDLKPITDEASHAAANYDALSYVWGHGEEPEKICVNGIDDYKITPNLAKALRNLRQPTGECRLWVDQICIDQQNKDEKTPQLRLLAKIYGQARNVLVWLGEPSPGVDLSFVRSEKEASLWALRKLKKQSQDVARAISTSNEYVSPWWTRSWVLEEYALAWKDPVALLGRERIAFDDLIGNMLPSLVFDMIPVLYFFGDGKSGDSASHLIMMTIMRELNFKRSFLSMAFLLRNTETENPQDKVFSIVTSLPEKQQNLICRDHDAPESTVFSKATIADIEASGTLAILGLVSRGPSTPRDYPSWAVDFTFRQKGESTKYRPPKFSAFQFQLKLGKGLVERNAKMLAAIASCVTSAIFRQDDSWRGWTTLQPGKTASWSVDDRCQRLNLAGLKFDTIGSVTQLDDPHSATSNAFHTISQTMLGSHTNKLMAFLDRKALSESERRVFDFIKYCSGAYGRLGATPATPSSTQKIAQKIAEGPISTGAVLALFKEWDRLIRPWNAKSLRESAPGAFKRLEKIENDNDSSLADFIGEILRSFRAMLFASMHLTECFKEAAFFITKAGFLGVGPPDIVNDDEVVLPFGSRYPMIVRRNGANAWHFMGLVYVRGIMDDELVDCCQRTMFEEKMYTLV
ncbi:hypothetical protein M409DRAFT_21590 [Zasmidium cellare ATCC 36951]|uniref:Heterokaryon incompatibility domain-containing protein n=1 Tax=Zasmidium cellare ATCC 36951 TaxID=1080233 RepID=A0A6A6CLX8_ZASCE|nr:uncharacterized protein M409DRAFT_21590 [Zasmidium cellare ATCC 36951]KAF2168145.1 hypothetical protein M409DRAFT_21590 [Zasmidium cellare ATCC 36951]